MSGHPKFFKFSSFFRCLFEGLVNHFIMDDAMRCDACILCRAWAGKASWVISLLALSQSIFCLQPYKVFRRIFGTRSGLQQIQSQQLNKISSWRTKQHCSMMIVFCVWPWVWSYHQRSAKETWLFTLSFCGSQVVQQCKHWAWHNLFPVGKIVGN